MIPIRHLLARSKKTSMATEATPPPMSSKVKPACPAAAEVTVSVTDLASTPSRGDDGGGDDGEGGTYVGHFCSYVPPSFLQSVLQVERFQHFLLHFLSFFFESSGHSFLHVLTSSSSLQNFLQNFLSEHDNGELGVGAGGELGGGEGEGGGGLGGGSGGGEGDSVGVPGGDGGAAGGGGDAGGGDAGGGGGGEGEGGGGEGGGGDVGGDSLQTASSSPARYPLSAATSATRTDVEGVAWDGSLAIASSVALLALGPNPHANTVAGRALTLFAASTAV